MMLVRLPGTLAIGALLATPLAAENVTCQGGAFTVRDAAERTDSICEAAATATEQLASCNLTIAETVTIEVTGAFSDRCLGLYHCDDRLIQLRPLEDYATYLSGNPDSPFSHLDPEVFFQSVLRHELAHAALSATPCPYEGCPVTRELVAYTMQIRFLSEADRAPFDRLVAQADRQMTRDDFSVIGLMLAREAFIENAYVFLSQQDDPCEFVSKIARGDIILDRPVR